MENEFVYVVRFLDRSAVPGDGREPTYVINYDSVEAVAHAIGHRGNREDIVEILRYGNPQKVRVTVPEPVVEIEA